MCPISSVSWQLCVCVCACVRAVCVRRRAAGRQGGGKAHLGQKVHPPPAGYGQRYVLDLVRHSCIKRPVKRT